jgi:hypothetical protein
MGGPIAIEQAEENLARYPVRKYIASMDEAAATPNFGKLVVDVAADANPV